MRSGEEGEEAGGDSEFLGVDTVAREEWCLLGLGGLLSGLAGLLEADRDTDLAGLAG